MKRCLKCDTLFEGEPWTCVACGYIPEKINGYLSFAPDLTGISAFDVHSFKDLGETLDNSFWFPPRNRLITWAFKKYFSNVKEYLEIAERVRLKKEMNSIIQKTGDLTNQIELFFQTDLYMSQAIHENAQIPYADFDENYGGS